MSGVRCYRSAALTHLGWVTEDDDVDVHDEPEGAIASALEGDLAPLTDEEKKYLTRPLVEETLAEADKDVIAPEKLSQAPIG